MFLLCSLSCAVSILCSPKQHIHITILHIQNKDQRTDAFRYGSDLVPVSKMDMLGINAAFADSPHIEMIGYIEKSVVESSNLLMGPGKLSLVGFLCLLL